MYFLANEHETPVQPIDEEEFTKLQKRRNSFFAAQKDGISQKNSGARNSRAVRSQNDNCYSLFGPPKKQGQNLFDLKQDRGVAKRTECVGEDQKQFNNCEKTTTQEDGAATRQLYS